MFLFLLTAREVRVSANVLAVRTPLITGTPGFVFHPGVAAVVCLNGENIAFANVKTGETAVVLYRG